MSNLVCGGKVIRGRRENVHALLYLISANVGVQQRNIHVTSVSK